MIHPLLPSPTEVVDAPPHPQAADGVRIELGSPQRFGYEWERYREILPESREQLCRWLGSTGLESFAGKTVLDVGCGMGRNPYWMAKAGAASVTAVDVDDRSLAAARENLNGLANVSVMKGSAYALDPERHGTFDRVTSIGVVHHLSEPATALERMWRCVRPGGDLVLWCYAKEGNRLALPAIQTCRWLGSRLPLPATHGLAKMITLGLWPAIKMMPFRTSYYAKLRQLSFKNVESIVFDQMLPTIANYWTRDEITALVGPLEGGRPHVEFVQGNSWHVRVTKVDA